MREEQKENPCEEILRFSYAPFKTLAVSLLIHNGAEFTLLPLAIWYSQDMFVERNVKIQNEDRILNIPRNSFKDWS